MNYWLAQLILAAQNRDRDTGWVQILIFVILTVFYAVGSIVKAKANKTALKEEKQVPRKPVRKPPAEAEGARELFKQPQRPVMPVPRSQARPQVAKPQVQPSRRKVTRPATARSAPYGAGVTSPQPAGMVMLEPQMAMPQVQPKLEKVTAGIAMPAEKQPARYLSEILSDYDDPERLRRAILHYEILGKPLSLRDPSEHII